MLMTVWVHSIAGRPIFFLRCSFRGKYRLNYIFERNSLSVTDGFLEQCLRWLHNASRTKSHSAHINYTPYLVEKANQTRKILNDKGDDGVKEQQTAFTNFTGHWRPNTWWISRLNDSTNSSGNRSQPPPPPPKLYIFEMKMGKNRCGSDLGRWNGRK